MCTSPHDSRESPLLHIAFETPILSVFFLSLELYMIKHPTRSQPKEPYEAAENVNISGIRGLKEERKTHETQANWLTKQLLIKNKVTKQQFY